MQTATQDALPLIRRGEPGCQDRVATMALRSVSQNGPEVVGRCVSADWESRRRERQARWSS